MIFEDRNTFEGQAGIYFIICLANGRFYIGSSYRLGKRYAEHLSGLKNNRHHSLTLQRAWNKYGEEAFIFRVVEVCNITTLTCREQWYLDNYLTYNNQIGFNMRPKAERNTGLILSEEAKDKIRQKALGREKSAETVEKLKQAWVEHRNEWTAASIATRGIEFEIQSPDGKLIRAKGIRAFSRQYGLDHSQLKRLLEGKHKEVKGWTLPGVQLVGAQRVISPEGQEFLIPRNGRTTFAKERNMNASGLGRLMRGLTDSYKGWTRPKEAICH